jgi:hypothetical protein
MPHSNTSTAPNYVDYLRAVTKNVQWHLDERRRVWEFESNGEPPPDGSDWFFLVNFPRTGSTVGAEILSAHPDIHCGNEEHVLPLFMTVLGSKLFMAPDLHESVRYTKQIEISPRNMRHLLDGWRKCVSDKPIFGDKGEMYFSHFGNACADVFPNCRFVLTVRNPLDTLASYINQDWAYYLNMSGDRIQFFRNILGKATDMLEYNTRWRDKAEVIEFERLTTKEEFVETYARVFEHLGADPERYNWDQGWNRCRHKPAIGRWKQDPVIGEFMDWLRKQNEAVCSLLENDYYLPDEALDPQSGLSDCPAEAPAFVDRPD